MCRWLHDVCHVVLDATLLTSLMCIVLVGVWSLCDSNQPHDGTLTVELIARAIEHAKARCLSDKVSFAFLGLG